MLSALDGAVSGLARTEASSIDRWFARAGAPPAADLARSGAPARSMADILAIATPAERDRFLSLSLDYGPGQGSEQLRVAIVEGGLARASDEVVVTNGAVEALLLSCAASAADGGIIAVAVPAYEGILRCAQASGASVLQVPVWREGDCTLGLEGFDDGLVAACSAVIVNSPHNPTGLKFERAALRDLAERCRRSGTVLIVDEVALATLDRHARSIAVEPVFSEGAVVSIGDVSKSLGLGGLRIGWLTTASTALRDRVTALRDLTSLGSSAPSQALASIALARSSQFSSATLAVRNRTSLDYWVRSWGGSLSPVPDDGLVAFPGIPLPMASIEFAEAARRVNVAVMPGSLFGCEGRLRIGLGIDPAVFADALGTLSGLLATS